MVCGLAILSIRTLLRFIMFVPHGYMTILLFGHLNAICPRPWHLKHLVFSTGFGRYFERVVGATRLAYQIKEHFTSFKETTFTFLPFGMTLQSKTLSIVWTQSKKWSASNWPWNSGISTLKSRWLLSLGENGLLDSPSLLKEASGLLSSPLGSLGYLCWRGFLSFSSPAFSVLVVGEVVFGGILLYPPIQPSL